MSCSETGEDSDRETACRYRFSGSESDFFVECDAEEGLEENRTLEERSIQPSQFMPRIPRPRRQSHQEEVEENWYVFI